jgi:hypothetical protein
MEAEIQRLDRDALFADRRAAAARVERETDEILAAAAELRRTHMVRFVDEMRARSHNRRERDRIITGLSPGRHRRSERPPGDIPLDLESRAGEAHSERRRP